MGYYPAMKKNGIMPFAARGMGLEIVILNEVSQRKTAITRYSHIVKSKNDMNELIYKTNTDI